MSHLCCKTILFYVFVFKDMATRLMIFLPCLLLFTLMEEAKPAVDASLGELKTRSFEDTLKKREEFHCK